MPGLALFTTLPTPKQEIVKLTNPIASKIELSEIRPSATRSIRLDGRPTSRKRTYGKLIAKCITPSPKNPRIFDFPGINKYVNSKLALPIEHKPQIKPNIYPSRGGGFSRKVYHEPADLLGMEKNLLFESYFNSK